MLAKAMGANKLIGVEMNDYRIDLAKKLGLVDHVFRPGEDTLEQILNVTNGKGVERAIDASANDAGRQLAIRATREWGKIAFVGEGGTCTFMPSPDIIHGQKTIYGSWVTSLWRMEELVERLVRWNIHPEDLITHEFPIEKAGEAYQLMAKETAVRLRLYLIRTEAGTGPAEEMQKLSDGSRDQNKLERVAEHGNGKEKRDSGSGGSRTGAETYAVYGM